MIASRIRMRDNIASLMNKEFLNKHHIRTGEYATSDDEGFNGAFTLGFEGEARRVFAIASDREGWQHVSVSFGKRNLSIGLTERPLNPEPVPYGRPIRKSGWHRDRTTRKKI